MKNVYKIFALLLVLIMSISMFVACNDNTTNTNTPTTPPDTTQEEQTGDISDILGGTNALPEGEKMQIPPTSGTYATGLINLGTYSTYTFVGNEYEFKYYKFGALQPDKCHSGTFALANEKLVLTVMVTDPDTGITNIVETKSFDYGRYADGRLLIGSSIFKKVESTTTE